MNGQADAIDYQAHRDFFREVLQEVHDIMAARYDTREVKITPLGMGGSRLSIPIRVDGVNSKGEKVRFFAKILGSSELMTARTIQLFKNIFLHTISKDPLFDLNATAEHMAKHQYDLLNQIHELKIPTARPLGYHPLKGNLWLLVEEYLNARPINMSKDMTESHLETGFTYLAKMHKNGIYHGDIKPENILFAEKVYIMDVGNFTDAAPAGEKMAYDLACMIASFLDYAPPERIVALALKHFSKKDVRHATEYIELIQRRPDINFSNATKEMLISLMLGSGKKGKETD
ncbi:MAG: 3-deoxy-D-manno-octulosonic-acid kinase [Methanomassiliicoccales archaeon PtaU1.Bin124]|nr:MAG: 3-deoxy-D-manno-octulosonic-acid kinase [Methanomassiliicoccales archaeon PtaU1.Bin124]